VRNRWSALILVGILASGCVSTTEITEDRVEGREWVTVETFRGDSVQLMDPYVKNDSLIGYGIVDKRRGELRVFYLQDVKTIRAHEFDTTGTTNAVAAAAVVLPVWFVRFGP